MLQVKTLTGNFSSERTPKEMLDDRSRSIVAMPRCYLRCSYHLVAIVQLFSRSAETSRA